jgi:hypothetical protein
VGIEVTNLDQQGRSAIKSNVDLKIYPNPSNGIYQFELDKVEMEGLEIIITDINGRNINSEFNLKNNSIDLSNQPNGVYFVKILQSNAVIHHQKLILIK